MEEADFSFRLRKTGYRIFFDASTTVWHYPQSSGNSQVMQTKRTEWFYSYFYNLAFFFKKERLFFSLAAGFPFCAALAFTQVLRNSLPIRCFGRMVSGYINGVKVNPILIRSSERARIT